MLADTATIRVTAGKGGKGAVAFSKIKMSLGPTGGSGGKGGDVYLEAVSDIGALRRFRTQKDFRAEDGRDGRSAFRDGRDGDALILFVPRGTVAKNEETGITLELTKTGERVLIAEGGKGGKGNFLYKSSRNTTPKESQPGLPGETATLALELKLIADIGLIGFPNAGKSSFLNEATNAKSKVANYPFTTLEPHLGVFGTLILADIPGLIEGASEGKGLGVKFLRHIERTRVLFHFLDVSETDPLRNYETIRNELGRYNPLLLKKPEYIILSKADTVDGMRLEEIISALLPLKKPVLPLSIYDPQRMNEAFALLSRLEKEVMKEESAL